MRFGLMRIISQVKSCTLAQGGCANGGLFVTSDWSAFLLFSGALDFNHGLGEELDALGIILPRERAR